MYGMTVRCSKDNKFSFGEQMTDADTTLVLPLSGLQRTQSNNGKYQSVPVGRAARIPRAPSYDAIFPSQAAAATRPSQGGYDDCGTQFNLRGSVDVYAASDETKETQSVFFHPPAIVPPPLGETANSLQMANEGLRAVSELPARYRSVFNEFSRFNAIQSRVLDDVLYTDKPLVLSAPTGSGKTVVFELAIIRLLASCNPGTATRSKIVYMAPIKALCSERQEDWTRKFGPLGLKCQELTGDSDMDDYFELQDVNIILTTPEKWDSMTRRWRDNKSLIQLVCLLLIDEVHLLNDDSRGATLEAVVSRMKTVHSSLTTASTLNRTNSSSCSRMRFLAVSATCPNVSDIATWLSSTEEQAMSCSIDESERPVQLRKVVLAYPEAASDFRFDMSLNYKLSTVIHQYSNQKPTLIFCSTRKSVQEAAKVLVKDARFLMNSQQRQRLNRVANLLKDSKLREMVLHGVAFHHAGMEHSDRRAVEELFSLGDLPVLLATSTLAMGVNLPAHLVIVKSTYYYAGGVCQEYSESQVLQMIGRAGRPQFDDSSTAVIMTKRSTKNKYENVLSGAQTIESNLHKHLIEHLNAEIVLGTITDVSVALHWLKSTFLFVRIQKNPKHYGLTEDLTKEALERRLQDMCIKNLDSLASFGLIKMTDGFDMKPAESGTVMARYCIAFDSMKTFTRVGASEDITDLIEVIASCKELEEVRLRVSDKRTLNALNKNKTQQTIRYPMSSRIKTTQMKVNCLIQATLGCLPITDFSLTQDVVKIFRSGTRLAKALCECLMLRTDCYRTLAAATALSTCFRARLWENSLYVARQLERVGVAMATALVHAGLTTFQRVSDKHPRELELIVNRHPPFGNQIRDSVAVLPQYELTLDQIPKFSADSAEIVVRWNLRNGDVLKQLSNPPKTFSVLLVGDADNRVVLKQRLSDTVLLNEKTWSKKIDVHRAAAGDELDVRLVNQEYVGLDVRRTFVPRYLGPRKLTSTCQTAPASVETVQPKRKSRKRTPASRLDDEVENNTYSESSQSASAPGRKKKPDLVQTGQKYSQTKTRVDAKKGGIASHLSDLQAKRMLVPHTPFKRLKMGECAKYPDQYDSAMPPLQAAQPCFDRFPYTSVKKQQGLPPGVSSITSTELVSQPPIGPSTVNSTDDSELNEFDWGYDDLWHIEGDTGGQDAKLDTSCSGRKDFVHRPVAPDVGQTNSQYFNNQRGYEMSYVDGCNDSFPDGCSLPVDTSIDISCFDSGEWIDEHDYQSREEEALLVLSSTRNSRSSFVPVEARTPQFDAPNPHHLCAADNSHTNSRYSAFSTKEKEQEMRRSTASFSSYTKHYVQLSEGTVSSANANRALNPAEQPRMEPPLKCKQVLSVEPAQFPILKSSVKSSKSASETFRGPSFFCAVTAGMQDDDKWEAYDGLFEDIFD